LGFFDRVEIELGLGLAWIGKDGLERKEGKDMTPASTSVFVFFFIFCFYFD